jgi:hypothetical protein
MGGAFFMHGMRPRPCRASLIINLLGRLVSLVFPSGVWQRIGRDWFCAVNFYKGARK